MKKLWIALPAACALGLYLPPVICQPIVPEGYTIESYATGIGAAAALAIGSDGSLYITDYARGQLLKRTASGALEVVASGLPNSNALAVHPSGRIFAGANSFYIYEIVGGVPQLFASGFSYISSMALKGDDLYVSSEDGISKVSTITGGVTLELSGVVNPYGVSFDDAGNMYFLSHALGEVYTYNFVDPPKYLANVTLYGGTYTGVGFGSRLFWGDYRLGTLFTLNSDGTTAEFATGFVGANPPANGPNAIVDRGAGVIFVADGSNVWRIVDPSLTDPPASAVTLTPNVASPAAIGATVTFTAAASGGSGSYQYKFLLRVPGGTLNTIRDYSTTPTWSWNTSGRVAGTYQVVVHARNVGSTKSYETYQAISYALATPPPTPASAVTLTPSVASPATVGATVTFTAAASGGSGSYQYKFLLRVPGGTLNTIRDYSTTPTWSWNTSGLVAGTYQVVVRARNVGSTKSYETYLSLSYLLKPQPPEYPETEYNDERDFADTFYLNSTAVGSLANAYDVDWFTVNIDQQITVKVTFDVTSTSSGVWNVYWYDRNLNVLSGRNISASPTVFEYEFPAFSPGPYYMRIQPTDPALYGGSVYKVTVTPAP